MEWLVGVSGRLWGLPKPGRCYEARGQEAEGNEQRQVPTESCVLHASGTARQATEEPLLLTTQGRIPLARPESPA